MCLKLPTCARFNYSPCQICTPRSFKSQEVSLQGAGATFLLEGAQSLSVPAAKTGKPQSGPRANSGELDFQGKIHLSRNPFYEPLSLMQNLPNRSIKAVFTDQLTQGSRSGTALLCVRTERMGDPKSNKRPVGVLSCVVKSQGTPL